MMARKRRGPQVRFFTMLVMLLSLITVAGGAASAAPGGSSDMRGASFQAADVTLDVCVALLGADLIDAEGAVVTDDLLADALAAGITLDADAVVAIGEGACGALLPPDDGATVDVDLCVALLDAGLIDAEGAVVTDDLLADALAAGITLDADAVVAIGEGACGALLPPDDGTDATDDGTDTADDGADATDGTDAVDGTDGTDGEPGSLVISKFECTQIEEPTATVSDPVGVAAAPEETPPEEGCVADSANFQIFINSDFTSDPIDVFVDGTATVNGLPSTEGGPPNALFEPAFNVFFSFEITPGGVTTITVLNPADDGDGATPIVDGDDDGGDGVADDGGDDGTGDDGADDGAGDDGADGDDDGADDGAGDDGADGDDNGADDDDDDGAVSGLPSTGQGSDGGASGSAIVLLFGAMSMVALAAGFAWRQRQTS